MSGIETYEDKHVQTHTSDIIYRRIISIVHTIFSDFELIIRLCVFVRQKFFGNKSIFKLMEMSYYLWWNEWVIKTQIVDCHTEWFSKVLISSCALMLFAKCLW